MKFPTYEEMGKEVAKRALDDFSVNDKTLREWINLMSNGMMPMSVIEDIRAEIQNMPKTYPHTDHIDDYVKTNDVLAVIDRHIGKEQTE